MGTAAAERWRDRRRSTQTRSSPRRAPIGTDPSYPIRHHLSGQELRLVSLADRAVGLQLMCFSLDRDGVDVKLEASSPCPGLAWSPPCCNRTGRLAYGRIRIKVWPWRAARRCGPVTLNRSPGTAVFAALGLALALRRRTAGRARPHCRCGTRRSAGGRSGAGRREALARNCALGWRAVLAAHEAAWHERWACERRRHRGRR